MCDVVDEWIHVFLTSPILGANWLASRPCRSISRKSASGMYWIGGCVGYKPVVDNIDKELELRQLLYRLRYRGSHINTHTHAHLYMCVNKFKIWISNHELCLPW
jgi:hypothetical protein